MINKASTSTTSTPSRDSIVSTAGGTSANADGDLTGEQWNEECGGEDWESWGDEMWDSHEQTDETWDGQELDGEPWRDGQEWEGESVDGQELGGENLEGTKTIEPRKLEFGESIVPVETDEDWEVGFCGLFWDPITYEQVELGSLTGHTLGDHGGWTAYYEGFDGHLYSLTRLEDEKSTKNSVVAHPKIVYKPLDKDGCSQFVENAWPKATEPTVSGLGQSASPSSSGTSPTSKIDPVEPYEYQESLNYPDQTTSKRWVAATLHRDLGEKPQGTDSPLDLDTLTNMNLSEHIQHVKWYTSAHVFKSKIPDGISKQFWEELVEIFKIYHGYGIDDPETVLSMLKMKYARESYG